MGENHNPFNKNDKRDLIMVFGWCSLIAALLGIVAWYTLWGIDESEKIIKEVEPQDIINSIPSVDDTLEGAIE